MIQTLIAVAALIVLSTGVFIYTKDEPIQIFSGNKEVSNIGTTTEIEREMVNAGKLVDMRNRSLTAVPMYLFDAVDTEELNLSGNKFTGALPAEVRQLQNLKVLDLSNNQFSGVPAEIGQLKKLEVLNLSNNMITGLPYELGSLTNLKILNLKGNIYSTSDLDIIKQGLPDSVVIEID